MTALFGSVILPVSEAWVDCAHKGTQHKVSRRAGAQDARMRLLSDSPFTQKHQLLKQPEERKLAQLSPQQPMENAAHRSVNGYAGDA
jgi:hypothetical protein